MGEALIGGLVRTGWAAPDEITVVEQLHSRCEDLREQFPGIEAVGTVSAATGRLSDAVIAVKPQDVRGACSQLLEVGVERVLSIAAGVPTSELESALGGSVPVVRAMPNTPALVAIGASAIAPGSLASQSDMDWARSILEAVGIVVEVAEKDLDAVTGLSGSGPAYVFLIAESLIEAGVFVGLPRDTAELLVVQTILGSATLMRESTDEVAALRAAVTSPGGTTASGLRELENSSVRAAFIAAVDAATKRSREMGAR